MKRFGSFRSWRPASRAVLGILVFFIGSLVAHSASEDVLQHARIQSLITELVEEGHYQRNDLIAVLAQAEHQQVILDAMQSPAEYKFTWGKYRNLFLQEDRIQQGVDFWLEHEASLARAEQEYGVPASFIVGILGVESKFGKYKGKHRVLDSLVTLIVGFERRSAFFASELKEFLILTKENGLDPLAMMGSYAGAMGYPQFISSSYRNYAVDFNGDGSVDLVNQVDDAIGSIANYFVENGWRRGLPVTSEAHTKVPAAVAELASRQRKVAHRASSLRELGAPLGEVIDGEEMLGVLMLNANPIVPEDADKKTYVVRAGDTACEIAERHQIPCKALFEANKLNAQGAIFRGQKLRLPSSAAKEKSAVAREKSSAAKEKSAVERKDNIKNSKWEVSEVHKDTTVDEDPAAEQPVYFFTHHNFYVITRYNQSVLYAMAVNDLAGQLQRNFENRNHGQSQ